LQGTFSRGLFGKIGVGARRRKMPSIKERIRRLSGGAKTKVDESPTGQIIFRGWLNKVGAGILASTFHKRFCVLHFDASGVPMLSMYEAMDVQTLKGARLPLTGATFSSADDKLQVVTEVEGQQTTAKFKASTKAEAVEWMSHLEMAAKGERPAGSAVPSSPAALTGKLMKPEEDSPAPKSSPSSARPERPAVRTAPATPAAMPEPTAAPPAPPATPGPLVTATPVLATVRSFHGLALHASAHHGAASSLFPTGGRDGAVGSSDGHFQRAASRASGEAEPRCAFGGVASSPASAVSARFISRRSPGGSRTAWRGAQEHAWSPDAAGGDGRDGHP